MSGNDNELGERLTWARQTAGLSIGQAARLLNLTSEQIIASESGDWPGMYAPAEAWCRVYDIDVHWLKTGIEREVDMSGLSAHVSDEDRESLRRLIARRWQNS